MKTITIRLPDVEAAMLEKLKKHNKGNGDFEVLLAEQIRNSYRRWLGP